MTKSRYKIIFLCAAGAITFFLFILMQVLVTREDGTIEDALARAQIDFVRIKRDEDINTKNRKPPRPQQKSNEPPPPVKHNKPPPPPPGSIAKNLPNFGRLSLLNSLAAPLDGEILPLVRVPPQYPARALARGMEGWVLLEFTVSKTGAVLDPKIVQADPPIMFNRAALRAVQRWKYKPQVINGKPADRTGVQTVIVFELEE